MPLFPPSLRKLLPQNLSPFGEVFPPKPNPAPGAKDGRTVALETMAAYVTAITFFKANKTGLPNIPFQIKLENFHIEWPDNEQDLVTPCAIVMPSRADYDVIGLNSYVEEETRDVYAPGTVLQWQDEYIETVNLEVRATSRAERRAMAAGIEIMFTPTEQMAGVRFRMPDYYQQLVCFELNRREIFDDESSAKGRRRAQFEILMRFNVVALVNYSPLTPVAKVNVDVDVDTQVPVAISPDDHSAQVVVDP